MGLTKLAKLDFFVRYPDFFQRAAGPRREGGTRHDDRRAVDSAMVRHHYGPWDARYYQILAYLESRELITVERQDKTFVFSPDRGRLGEGRAARRAGTLPGVCRHMQEVKKLFGNKSGDTLKKLVYELFDEEVAKLPLGEVIGP